jgi:membrane protease YdiL (CAAX protease family)
MKKLFPVFIWWLTFALLWSVYRIFPFPQTISEFIAKPLIWLGVTGVFFSVKIIPKEVLQTLKQAYLGFHPIWKIFVLPIIFITVYFLFINIFTLSLIKFNFASLAYILTINLVTAVVEEVIFRGVLYVWLLQKTSEVPAFILTVVLFILIHLPKFLMEFTSVATLLTQIFFVLLLGSIFTGVFRVNKSLYSSIATHWAWNALTQVFLL